LTRKIGVLTTGRADYGILFPILTAIQRDRDLELLLFVTGMHLSPEFGMSVREIECDGFAIDERVEILISSDMPEGIVKSMGLAMIGFSQVFARRAPDIFLVVGDRFEVQAAVSACVPFSIPVAHVHGGEVTEGAIDEVFRHSISKMSHLHFATTQTYANRIAQMGEEEWRIRVSGAPGLDNFLNMVVPSREQVEEALSIDLEDRVLLATYHPPTRVLSGEDSGIDALLEAIRELDMQVVFTYPNADAGGRAIIAKIEEFKKSYAKITVAINASQSIYIGLMKYAAAMVGNSSSGIIEAASFGLPVVNVGPRQAGRIRARNVIDVLNEKTSLISALEKAVSAEFREELEGLVNPYGDGRASETIVGTLKRVNIDSGLLRKKFADVENSLSSSQRPGRG